MAWVWIGRAGAEMRTALEMPAEDTTFGSATQTIVATPKTGTYSFGSTSNTRPRGWTFTSKTSIRAGAFISYVGVTTGRIGNIFKLVTSGISNITVELNGTTQTIDLVVNGSIEDSVALASSGMPTAGVFYQIGIAYSADATTGYVTFYVEGVAKLTFTGNTGTGCTAFYVMGNRASSGWTGTSNIDDVYVDGSVSAETDASPPAKQLDFGLATTAGNYAQWTPSASTNVSNVDDAVPDDDTTYNSATSSGLFDSYNTANPTYAGGLTLVAVLPVAHLRLTDGGFASTVKLGLRESSTNVVGSDISLATAYATKMDRQTSKPSGGDWDTTAANAVEFLIESSGVYS